MIETLAPAKINLYLHVTGQRADGYHYLDSLVAFTNIGDRLQLHPADKFRFFMDGPFAGSLLDQDSESNLAVRAVRLLAKELNRPLDFELTLTKNLPIASGIGGGSTDAAGALRLAAAHYGLAPDASLLYEIASSLGQDIPCCIAAQTCTFEGIGDVVGPGPELPLTHMVLVNPGVGLSTPSVFKNRKEEFLAPSPLLSDPCDTRELCTMLSARSNNLTPSAIELCPVIADILNALKMQEGCLLHRMSGSGATCFGLFEDRAGAKSAAARLYEAHPDWWVVPCFIPQQG